VVGASRGFMGVGGKGFYVRRVFDRIARRYDVMNVVMSLGFDWVWRRKAALFCCSNGCSMCLDVCTGSGKVALELARLVGGGGRVYALDFSREMLSIAFSAVERAGRSGVVQLVGGDALNLPFDSNTFDCVTAAFCLRNVEDLWRALREMVRVAKPGGRVVILDLSRPSNKLYFKLGDFYLRALVPALGQLIVGERDPYAYMHYSLTNFPVREELAKLMERAGLRSVRFYEFNLGMVGIHVGIKPSREASGP